MNPNTESESLPLESEIRHRFLWAWGNVRLSNRTPFIDALEGFLQALPTKEGTLHSIYESCRKFKQRICQRPSDFSVGYCLIPCLENCNQRTGDWEISNHDLEVYASFARWIERSPDDQRLGLSHLLAEFEHALVLKRMQQAYDRYKVRGFTEAHCRLLANARWHVNTWRGDGVSLYVQGKRPFGNSGIAHDIYKHAGWERDWDTESDEGMPLECEERAWNLFDELPFAAVDAAKRAEESFTVNS
jgi:hypothetical protein